MNAGHYAFKIRLLVTAVLAFMGLTVHAAEVGWVDWTSTSAGTLSTGGPAFNVSLSGPSRWYTDGDSYFNNGSTGGTSPSGTYGGLAPSDLIQTSSTGLFTFTFDQAVVNPYLAIVSQGQGGLPVTYDFGNTAYNVISSGGNYWGYTGYDATNPNKFKGYEYNGVLQLLGTFTTITLNVENPEYWHGFNIGASAPSAVPLPAAAWLFGSAVLGFVSLSNRRKV